MFKYKQIKRLSRWAGVFVGLLFSSCAKPVSTSQSQFAPADTLQVDYAEGFDVIYHEGFKEVLVYNPWKTDAVYARYYLVSEDTVAVPTDGTKVKVPLADVALTSVTQIEFVRMLGALETVTGICSPALVYNEALRGRIAAGAVVDLGDAFSVNVERALMLRPAAVLTSGYNQNDPNMSRIARAGIPVLYDNEWMETSLPGRAEWVKFVGAFYDKEEEADTLFAQVVRRYEAMRRLVAGVTDRPQVMSGSAFRGTWYMPGGNSFMGRLFRDAEAGYFYADDRTTGSLPLTMEAAVMYFSEADVWLNCGFDTRDELLAADPKHALFRPVQNGEVYNFNKRMSSTGANDFWESAVARPDLLLADLIAVLHPHLLPGYETVYTDKLK